MRARKIIKIILTVLLLSYIAYYIVNNTEEFFKLSHVTVWQLVQMFIIYCILLSVIGTRMFIIMNACGLSNIKYFNWIEIFILARFFNKIIPQLGNIYRALKLKEDYGFTYMKYIGTFMAFIWFDIVTILCLITIVVFVTEKSMLIFGIPTYLWSFVLLFLFTIAPIFISFIAKYGIETQGRLHNVLSECHNIIGVIASPTFIIKQLIFSMLSFVLYASLLYLCALSIKVEIPINMLVMFSAIIKLSTYIVITPGNIGIKEISLGYLSIASNLDFADGVMIAAISRLIIYISTITLGCIFGGIPMIKEIQNYKKNKPDSIY